MAVPVDDGLDDDEIQPGQHRKNGSHQRYLRDSKSNEQVEAVVRNPTDVGVDDARNVGQAAPNPFDVAVDLEQDGRGVAVGQIPVTQARLGHVRAPGPQRKDAGYSFRFRRPRQPEIFHTVRVSRRRYKPPGYTRQKEYRRFALLFSYGSRRSAFDTHRRPQARIRGHHRARRGDPRHRGATDSRRRRSERVGKDDAHSHLARNPPTHFRVGRGQRHRPAVVHRD